MRLKEGEQARELDQLAESPFVLKSVGAEPDDLRRERSEPAQRGDETLADDRRGTRPLSGEEELSGDAGREQRRDGRGHAQFLLHLYVPPSSSDLSCEI